MDTSEKGWRAHRNNQIFTYLQVLYPEKKGFWGLVWTGALCFSLKEQLLSFPPFVPCTPYSPVVCCPFRHWLSLKGRQSHTKKNVNEKNNWQRPKAFKWVILHDVFLSCVIKSAAFLVIWMHSREMQIVTTNIITGQENGLFRPLPLGMFHSVISWCVQFQVGVWKFTLLIPVWYKQLKHDMGVPLGNCASKTVSATLCEVTDFNS